MRVKLVAKRVYEIFKYEDGKMTLVETREFAGRPKEVELSKEYGFKVTIVLKETVKETFEVSEETIREHGTLVEE